MTNYCFTAPILEGGIELMKKWIEENIVNNKEHDAVFNTAGISRETVWIQHLPQGDYAVASYDTDDPEYSFKVLTTSNDPWAVKFRDHLKKVHGIDLSTGHPPLLNKMMVDWNKET
jgi:hypothetical protein